MTDEMVEQPDFYHLVKACEELLHSKGIVPPPDLSAKIEHAMCELLVGYKFCVPCTRAQQTLGFGAIVRWVTAMYNFAVKGGFQLVDQEEAERRARICAACPNQIETSGCWGCRGIAGMLPAIAGARKTESDFQLKACGVCGCYNAISVHLPTSVQGGDDLQFPEWCWKAQHTQSE